MEHDGISNKVTWNVEWMPGPLHVMAAAEGFAKATE
jgi:hypothetical protein